MGTRLSRSVSDGASGAATAPAWSQGQRWLAGAAALLVVIGLWIANDAVLAAPIAAVTALAGSWFSFALFSVVYSLGSFLLALLALRAYERYSKGQPSRLASWLEGQGRSVRFRWARPLAVGGGVLGFVVASIVLGGVLTTWFLRYSGQRRHLVGAAALSSLIFGVTFTATYAGIFHFVI